MKIASGDDRQVSAWPRGAARPCVNSGPPTGHGEPGRGVVNPGAQPSSQGKGYRTPDDAAAGVSPYRRATTTGTYSTPKMASPLWEERHWRVAVTHPDEPDADELKQVADVAGAHEVKQHLLAVEPGRDLERDRVARRG